jgi:hypothetical protein
MYFDDSDFDDLSEDEHSDAPSFVCDHCGEEIVLMLDHHEGERQQFVQDCSVC